VTVWLLFASDHGKYIAARDGLRTRWRDVAANKAESKRTPRLDQKLHLLDVVARCGARVKREGEIDMNNVSKAGPGIA
jgi:hypothetical protein